MRNHAVSITGSIKRLSASGSPQYFGSVYRRSSWANSQLARPNYLPTAARVFLCWLLVSGDWARCSAPVCSSPLFQVQYKAARSGSTEMMMPGHPGCVYRACSSSGPAWDLVLGLPLFAFSSAHHSSVTATPVSPMPRVFSLMSLHIIWRWVPPAAVSPWPRTRTWYRIRPLAVAAVAGRRDADRLGGSGADTFSSVRVWRVALEQTSA